MMISLLSAKTCASFSYVLQQQLQCNDMPENKGQSSYFEDTSNIGDFSTAAVENVKRWSDWNSINEYKQTQEDITKDLVFTVSRLSLKTNFDPVLGWPTTIRSCSPFSVAKFHFSLTYVCCCPRCCH